jgi:hypothetical protein
LQNSQVMALQRQQFENAFGHPVQQIAAGEEEELLQANAVALPVQRQDETPTSAHDGSEARGTAGAAAVEQEAPERVSKKGWGRLAIEATGHFLQATVQTVGGLIAAIGTGGAALLPGIVSAVGGVGQAIIGICKSIRAHFIRMRKAVAKKTAMNRLIAFEGVVAAATAIAGLVAGVLSPDFWRALVTGLLKAVDVVGGVIKTLRGVFAGYLSNRSKGILIMIESGLGFLSGLGSSIGAGIAKGGSWIFNVVAQVLKQIVSVFKGARGYAKASE